MMPESVGKPQHTEPERPRTWEVEQKYVVQLVAAVEERLADLGFVLLREEQQQDIYFRHPCRDFSSTDEALRLRQQNQRTFVTYKGRRLEAAIKTRPEIELEVRGDEHSDWRHMLQCLGFEPLENVRKRRRVYQLRDEGAAADSLEPRPLVALDEVEGLGSFAEIELMVRDPDMIPLAHRQIDELASRLSLTEVQPRSYLSQLLAKRESR